MEKTVESFSWQADGAIEGAIITYKITSEGDTNYILRQLIETVMEILGRELTR